MIGIVLAAGASTRMGTPKALLERSPGSTFLARVASTLRDAGADRVLVVVAKPHRERIAAAARALGAEPVENPRPDLGQVHSMSVGLAAAAPEAFALIALADVPDWGPQTGSTLREAASRAPEAVHIPTFRGERGHPIAAPTSLAHALREARPGEGCRDVVERIGIPVVEHPVDDAGILLDVDAPVDLALLEVLP